MAEDNAENPKTEPEKITRADANRLNNFAQGLDDEITHVVDYGELGDESDNE